MRLDKDMVRASELLADARSVADQRGWRILAYFLDQAEAVLLSIHPFDGEKGGVDFKPILSRFRSEREDW